MSVSLRRLLETSTFRLALIYLASFGISALALLGFLYYETAGFMARQTDETIQAEIAGLVEQYRAEGLDRLSKVIGLRSERQPHRASIYLMIDPFGRRIVGNLDRWPEIDPARKLAELSQWRSPPDGETVQQRQARAASFPLLRAFSCWSGATSRTGCRSRRRSGARWVGVSR